MFRWQRFLILVLFACGVGLTAEVPAPAGGEAAATRRARQVFAELNAGPAADYSKFILRATTDEMRAKHGMEGLNSFLQELATLLGQSELTRKLAEPVIWQDGWAMDMFNAAGEPRQFYVRLGPAPDYRIDGLGVTTRPLDTPPIMRIPIAQLPMMVGIYLSNLTASDGFSGAVVIAKNGKQLFGKAYGAADRAAGRKNTLDTPFNLGSMNKMFTAIAVGLLVQQKKLSLDDTVGKILPDYPNEEVRQKVTVQQLLAHRAGIPSYWNDTYFDTKDSLKSIADFVSAFSHLPLEFEPGSEYRYSNGGPVILGLMIEKLSGESYYEFVRNHVYRPAGMTHSDHYAKDDKKAGFAVGYERKQASDPWKPNSEFLGRIGSPAGGGYASANDLVRFADALLKNLLVNAQTRDELWQEQTKIRDDFGYASLFGVGTINGHRWVGHNGGAPGVSVDLRIYPETGYAVIVLSNHGGVAGDLSNWVNRMIAEAI